ncbi:MAG: helix-turn-helix transcriptional regulator [Legionellales bacterium]|jgi:transcriptional regulator with XRE-family HTH domain
MDNHMDNKPMNEHNEQIQQLLNEISKNHKISLRKLGKAIGVSQPTLTRIRSGTTKRVSAIVLLKLLDFKKANNPKLNNNQSIP